MKQLIREMDEAGLFTQTPEKDDEDSGPHAGQGPGAS